jgi:hypothetical protein
VIERASVPPFTIHDPRFAIHQEATSASASFFLVRLQLLLPEIRLDPVRLEHVEQFFHRLRVPGDQANLPAGVEFQRAQALAADEGGLAVTHHRADVQPHAGHFLHSQVAPALADLAMIRMSTPALCRCMSSRSICVSATFGSQITSCFFVRLMKVASSSRAFSGLMTNPWLFGSKSSRVASDSNRRSASRTILRSRVTRPKLGWPDHGP